MSFAAESLSMDKHFPMMVEWWKSRNFPHPDPRFLPPDGLVITYSGIPVCGGFLFKTNANIAIMGNIVSNPAVESKIRSEAVDLLMVGLVEMAKQAGMGIIAGSTNLPQLQARYEKLGFKKTDEQVSHFGRFI